MQSDLFPILEKRIKNFSTLSNLMKRVISLFFLAASFIRIDTVYAQTVLINPNSGFYSDSTVVELDFNVDSLSIFYTTDGSIPDTTDSSYLNSITIKNTQTIRWVAYTAGYLDTTYFNKIYFIDENTELPVLSLTTDPDNLFSNKRGIYVEGTNGIPGYCRDSPKNWNQDWERPARLDFFEKNRGEGFTIDAGIKIGGGCTRLYDQKSLDIYFRGDYGASKLEYQVFKDKPITSFDRLALRSGGQDWYRALIRNAATQSMVRDRMDLGYQAFKPVAVFINGEYWGIHMLREKQNEDFIESNYGYNENELDILATNANVKEGSADHYNAMIDFIKQNDITLSANYTWVSDQMDIDQYIDYQIAQIYWANGDWPANNIIFWRPQEVGGKWKWLLYDVDMSMGSHSRGVYNTNILKKLTTTSNTPYESPTWATFLFRSLIENDKFRNKFIQRYSMHIHTTFEPSRMMSFIDSTAALVESEIPRHMGRWSKSLRLGSNMNWEKHLTVIEDFISLRKQYAKSHLSEQFDLTRLNSLETIIQPAEAGKVYIENVRSDELEYGLIYNSVPTNIKAVSNPGYTFIGWGGALSGSEIETDITINENTSLTAYFKRNEINSTGVVINEINYRSEDNFNPEDWIEFYNNSDQTVDMSGWLFSDSGDGNEFIFKDNTQLFSGDYLVLARDSIKFEQSFPEVNNKTGYMNFGFSGDGESLQLSDNLGNIVDELTYNDKYPWPTEADGLGATLSLTNPGFDNSKGENWAASSGHGTPGKINESVFVNNEEDKDSELPSETRLDQNYPNPFNPVTVIKYSLKQSGLVKLKVFDLQGRLISEIENGMKSPGIYEVRWNASGYASGVYFYRLEVNGIVLTRKLTLIK
tara:strand:- start:35221 stop:37830 length:2610 start_codon:yes stop_codon:yes gene_type:complete